jgi:hypothetical protein
MTPYLRSRALADSVVCAADGKCCDTYSRKHTQNYASGTCFDAIVCCFEKWEVKMLLQVYRSHDQKLKRTVEFALPL